MCDAGNIYWPDSDSVDERSTGSRPNDFFFALIHTPIAIAIRKNKVVSGRAPC